MTPDELLRLRLAIAQRFVIAHRKAGTQFMDLSTPPRHYDINVAALQEADDLLREAGIEVGPV